LSPSANDTLQYISGAWANRTPAQVKSTLAIAQSDVIGLSALLASMGVLNTNDGDIFNITQFRTAGSKGQAADANHQHTIEGVAIPSDSGFLAWNYDPVLSQGQFTLNGSQLTLLRVDIKKSFTWTNVCVYMISAGSGTGFFAGLYASNGTRIIGSADQSTLLHATGPVLVEIPLSAAQAMTTGTFVWVALLSTMSGQPFLAKSNAYAGNMNGKLTAANYRVATNGGTQSTLPSSITPSANLATAGVGVWVGAT
jgi:hypothetical protein